MATDLTREELIEAARSLAAARETPLTLSDFSEATGASEWDINRLFPEGRWLELLQLAGIDRPVDGRARTETELLTQLHRAVELRGALPADDAEYAEAGLSAEILLRRFGGLDQALKAYRSWLERVHPDSPALDLVPDRSETRVHAPPHWARGQASRPPMRWAESEGPVLGPPLDFRGLRYAPMNERGVVYVFGMVSEELGFLVEAIHDDPPGCDAMRRIDGDRWQRAAIRFVHRTSELHDRGGVVEGRDLVICWEHDEPDCPLEVLELRSALDDLRT